MLEEIISSQEKPESNSVIPVDLCRLGQTPTLLSFSNRIINSLKPWDQVGAIIPQVNNNS